MLKGDKVISIFTSSLARMQTTVYKREGGRVRERESKGERARKRLTKCLPQRQDGKGGRETEGTVAENVHELNKYLAFCLCFFVFLFLLQRILYSV